MKRLRTLASIAPKTNTGNLILNLKAVEMPTTSKFRWCSASHLLSELTEIRRYIQLGMLRLCVTQDNQIAGYLVTALDIATFPDYPENYTVADRPLSIQEFRKAIPKGLVALSKAAEITPITMQGRVGLVWVAPSMHPHLPIPEYQKR